MSEKRKTGVVDPKHEEPGRARPGAADPATREKKEGKRKRRRSHQRESSRVARILTAFAEVLVIVSVIAAPLMLGSVPLWSVGVGLALSVMAIGALGVAAFLEGRALPLHPVSLLLALVVAWEAFQLIPLPPGLLAALSPRAAEIFELTLGGAGHWPAWRPISLDPIATGVAVTRHGSWLLLFMAAMALSRSRPRRKRLIASLGVSVALVVILAFSQKLIGTDRIFGVYPTRPGGWLFAAFVNPNHLGAYLDLLAPVCLGLALHVRDRSRAALWGLVFVLAGATCLLTLSRGGIVALVVALTVFAILRRRLQEPSHDRVAAELPGEHQSWIWAQASSLMHRGRVAARAFGPALLVGGTLATGAYLALDPILSEVHTLIDQDSMADEVRWRIWSGALPLIRDFWATGIGRDAFVVTYPMYKDFAGQVTFSHAENQLVQALSELGVVATVMLCVGLASAWFSVARRRDLDAMQVGLLAGLAGLALHEMADFATSFGGVGVPASVALGILLGAGLRGEARGKGRRRRGDPASPKPDSMGRGNSIRSLAWIPRYLGAAPLLAACLVMVALGSSSLARAWAYEDDEELVRVVARIEAGDPISDVISTAMKRRPTDHILPLVAARQSIVRGNVAEAMQWVNLAIHLAPTESRGHLLAAEVLARAGHKRQALLQYRLAAQWGQPIRRVLSLAAVRYPAVEHLASAAPDTIEGRRELMRFLAAARRHDEALTIGRKALLQEPEDVELLVLAATSAQRLGLHEDSERFSRRLLSVDAREGRGYRLLASVKMAMGEPEGAIEILEEGLRMLPRDVSLSMQLARALLRGSRDPDKALDVLAEMHVPSNDRTRSRMHALRGDAHRERGRTRQALEEYRTATRFAPDDHRPWVSMGDHLMATDQWERALEAYLEARRRRSTSAIEARVQRAEKRVEALREFRARERIFGDGEVELPVPEGSR